MMNMVTLDFSKCKTVEDVEKVFKSKENELKHIPKTMPQKAKDKAIHGVGAKVEVQECSICGWEKSMGMPLENGQWICDECQAKSLEND
jgi:hypothetical protein